MDRVDYDWETARAIIENLSGYYLNARYKETIDALSKVIGRKEAKEYLIKTNELVVWLTQKMKPLP